MWLREDDYPRRFLGFQLQVERVSTGVGYHYHLLYSVFVFVFVDIYRFTLSTDRETQSPLSVSR